MLTKVLIKSDINNNENFASGIFSPYNNRQSIEDQSLKSIPKLISKEEGNNLLPLKIQERNSSKTNLSLDHHFNDTHSTGGFPDRVDCQNTEE